MLLTLHLNGVDHQVEVRPDQTLLDVLRESLGLGSVREACSIGVCGTCTVLLDSQAMSSCLLLAAQAEGKEIVTVEGLAEGGHLHPVQQAYIDHGAFQCAYCTPGFILTTIALLQEKPNPDDQTILEYLEGNLCRCGSYVNILAAVRACRRELE
jgi:aerobic-type carbon monoxide dehydrogenase small subunit (CoxS/CutS family)